MSNSIWTTVEIHCISCGFSYQQYLSTHRFLNIVAAPLTEEGYNALGRMFDTELEQANLGASEEIIPLGVFDGR